MDNTVKFVVEMSPEFLQAFAGSIAILRKQENLTDQEKMDLAGKEVKSWMINRVTAVRNYQNAQQLKAMTENIVISLATTE